MAEARNSEHEEQTALHNPDPPDDGVRKTLGPKPFVSMLLLMTGAMFAAVGQHAFYAHANGNDVETFFIPQEWVIRIGTGFAYVFQIVLVAAVTSAYAHRFEGTQGRKRSRGRKLLSLPEILGYKYGGWRWRYVTCVLALLPLLNFGDGVVCFSASNPSKYAFTISASMSTSLTHESSISEYPSQ
jgi:hypothetical protein